MGRRPYLELGIPIGEPEIGKPRRLHCVEAEGAESVPDVNSLTRGMSKLDDACYEMFFAHYYRRLWTYLSVLSDGNEEDAEEALQQTFEKVVKNIDVFTDENKFWAWLATIAKNTYRDLRRKRSRLSRFRDALLNLTAVTLGQSETDEQLDSITLEQAVSRLTDGEQQLIRHKYYTGLSHREMAHNLGISEKAVESRLARVRTKLREFLIDNQLDELG